MKYAEYKKYPKWDCKCTDYDYDYDCMDYAPKMDECCIPKMKCEKECVKTFTCTYKLYKICCYKLYKACPRCHYEFDYHKHGGMCPRCSRMY